MPNAYSQSPMLWSKDFATGHNRHYPMYPNKNLQSIQILADTIKVIGRKNTSNGQRLSIVKYDLLGNAISTKTYGNNSVFNNSIIDYKFDSTNHLYILHKEQLGFYKSKIVLQKYSPGGNLIWLEQMQSPADTSYTPTSIGLTNDTHLFVAAYKEYDYPESLNEDVINTVTIPQLYSYDSNGNQLWLREFNPNTEIKWFPYEIFIHSNKAFLFGYNTSDINRLVKVDLNNNLTINTSAGIQNGINNVQLTPDNKLLITSGINYRISKVNLNGTAIWTADYGTNLPSHVIGDEIKATLQDSAGNIYVTGKHYGENYGTSNYTNADIFTIKYDSSGNLIWQNRYGYGGNNADIGNTMILKNGQIYVGGESQSSGVGTDYDYVVLKIGSISGASTGVYRYGGIANGDDAVYSLAVFDNGNVALTGRSYINSQYDWTTQLLSGILSVQNNSSPNNFQVYPNPIGTGKILKINGEGIKSYSIISFLGQVVQQGFLEPSDFHKIQLDNLTTGMYLLNLQTDKEIVTSKIIVR